MTWIRSLSKRLLGIHVVTSRRLLSALIVLRIRFYFIFNFNIISINAIHNVCACSQSKCYVYTQCRQVCGGRFIINGTYFSFRKLLFVYANILFEKNAQKLSHKKKNVTINVIQSLIPFFSEATDVYLYIHARVLYVRLFRKCQIQYRLKVFRRDNTRIFFLRKKCCKDKVIQYTEWSFRVKISKYISIKKTYVLIYKRVRIYVGTKSIKRFLPTEVNYKTQSKHGSFSNWLEKLFKTCFKNVLKSTVVIS